MKCLVLIDGNALLHRAYHATPPFTTSKGELVNAVYGFSAMLLKVLSELKPDYLAICWDEKGPTFRHQTYTQYKATRGPADEALSNQYERVYEVSKVFNIPEFKLSGYEADDLIATLAYQAQKNKNLQVIAVTGDRDIMQLINGNLKVFMPKKTLQDVGLYGEEEFAVKYGFEPRQLVDYKALAGDASDNIPGVSGIGDVTATKLIHKFGSIEEIYKDLLRSRSEDSITLARRTLPFSSEKGKSENFVIPERLKKLLLEGYESAVMSKKLATLDAKAPIKLNLEKCVVHDFDREMVVKLFGELEFKSLMSRIPGSSVIPARFAKRANAGIQLIESGSELDPRLRGDDNEKSKIIQNQITSDLDKSVQPVLEKMSKTGILVNLKFLGGFGKDLKGKLAKIEQEIYSKVGHEFNLNSPKQLQIVLFDELKLPVFRKTKTGRSTDEETLHELSAAHPVVPLLLEYRQLFKLVSTYIDALPKSVAKDGRIHSTFNVEGSATGRISSQNPNLQNIPIKGELGGEIRKAFIAPKGKLFLGADYSQIELRIMAHLADDPALKQAFKDGLDIHAITAAKIFKVPAGKVTKGQRMVGKTMNFATLYGQGPHALSRQLGVEYEMARQYIEEYFEGFPRVRDWMAKTLEFGYENGYVETLWGRRRYIPELKADNRMIKAAGERAAINHPVQGTAADMIKKAMVDISNVIPAKAGIHTNNRSRIKSGMTDGCSLILQVHDELLFECSPKEVKEIAKMVKDKMENALKLSVPVVVDLKIGPNWGEMKEIRI